MIFLTKSVQITPKALPEQPKTEVLVIANSNQKSAEKEIIEDHGGTFFDTGNVNARGIDSLKVLEMYPRIRAEVCINTIFLK